MAESSKPKNRGNDFAGGGIYSEEKDIREAVIVRRGQRKKRFPNQIAKIPNHLLGLRKGSGIFAATDFQGVAFVVKEEETLTTRARCSRGEKGNRDYVVKG